MENLWGDINLSEASNMLSPRTILQEQSKHLEGLTSGIIYCTVEEEKALQLSLGHLLSENPTSFKYNFYIKSRRLPNYRYKAFSFNHNIEIYPVHITMDELIANEIELDVLEFSKTDPNDRNSIKVINKNNFEEIVKLIFQSDRMISVISSILSLSK